jgi:hypothetical protein
VVNRQPIVRRLSVAAIQSSVSDRSINARATLMKSGVEGGEVVEQRKRLLFFGLLVVDFWTAACVISNRKRQREESRGLAYKNV